MTETLKWEAEVVDKATKVLNDIAKSASGADKSVKGATKSTDDMGKASAKGAASTGRMAAVLGTATAAAGMFAAGVVAAAAAVVGLVQAGLHLTEQFREQDDAERQLIRTLEGTGAATEELRRGYENLTAAANAQAIATRSGDEANIRALVAIQSATREVLSREKAELALSTALGIVANRNKSVEEASKLYGAALKGEIEPLKEVLDLTKDQLQELGRMKNGTDRAALAVKLLEERYAGLGEETQTFFSAQKNLQDAIGDTQQALGRVIVESGAFTPIIELMTEALWGVQEVVGENEEAWGQWLRDGVIKGFEYTSKFLQLLQTGSPIIAGIATYVSTMANAWRIHNNVIQIVAKAVTGLVTTVVGGIITMLEPIRGIAVSAAKYLDDDLGAVFEGLKGHIDRAGESLTDFGATSFAGIDTDINDIADSIGGIVDSIQGLPELDGQISTQLQSVIANIESKTEALRSVQRNVRAIDSAQGGRSRAAAEEAAKTAELKKQTQDLRFRNQLARIDIMLSRERDELAALRIQKTRQVVELTEQITKGELTQLEIQARRFEIEREYETSLKALQEERLAARREKEEQLHREQMERLDASLERQSEFFRSVSDAVSSIGGTTGPALAGMLNNVDLITAGFRRMRAEGQSAAQALASAVSAGGSAAGQFLKEMGLNYRELAGVRAIFETGAAAASAASYDFFAAGKHAFAAATFGAVAIGGGSGGGSGAGGGGQQAQQTQRVGPSLEELYNTTRQGVVDGMREAQEANATSATYVITGNTFLENNTSALRDLNNVLQGAAQLRLT